MIIDIKNDKHWHELRKKTIGGSECGVVFNMSSYCTLHELYHIKKGNLKDTADSRLMYFGRALEPIIAELITQEYAMKLQNCQQYHIHPDYPFLGATLDYYVLDSENGPGILEIKNVQQFSPGWTDISAPPYIELQLQHQLLVVNAARQQAGLTPYKWGAIGSLHSGNPEDIRVMYREPDEKIHSEIIKHCSEFWAMVENSQEPPLFDERDLSHIVDLFKIAQPTDVKLLDFIQDVDLDELAKQYIDYGEQYNKYKKQRDAIKAKILNKLMQDKDHTVYKNTAARTQNFGIETQVKTIVRKPQPQKETETLYFKIREVIE